MMNRIKGWFTKKEPTVAAKPVEKEGRWVVTTPSDHWRDFGYAPTIDWFAVYGVIEIMKSVDNMAFVFNKETDADNFITVWGGAKA